MLGQPVSVLIVSLKQTHSKGFDYDDRQSLYFKTNYR